MSRDRIYLLHVVDSAEAILGYTTGGREEFLADRRTQDAVVRNIEVIGEAVKAVSSDTRTMDPDVPWRQMAGMRDKLIHEYFGVDLNLVWDVVEQDLPALLPRLRALIERLGERGA